MTQEETKVYYTTYGSVCGDCGHKHQAGLLRAARNALEDLQALSKGETTIEEVGGVIIELRNAIYSTTSDPDY